MGDSNCELSQAFGEFVASVPDGPPGYPYFIFHAGTLPIPPVSLATDRLLFRKLHRDYNGWYRADALWLYVTPEKCRQLGILLLAACFHGPAKETTLTMTHPDSEIRRIVIPAFKPTLEDPPGGLSVIPFALRYYPKETDKHPWVCESNTLDLPVFALSNANECIGTDQDWSSRDTIRLGSFFGTILFAELLLNAGCSWNKVREYALEGDAGFRGVGPMSAELRIFLPGSDGWIFPDGDVPRPEDLT